MSIPLGKILLSESHILYQVRVFDHSERPHPPPRQAFSFGTFVAFPSADPNDPLLPPSTLDSPFPTPSSFADSTSHRDSISDAVPPPDATSDDSTSDDAWVIGIVADSRLINPDAGNYGPRLTSPR